MSLLDKIKAHPAIVGLKTKVYETRTRGEWFTSVFYQVRVRSHYSIDGVPGIYFRAKTLDEVWSKLSKAKEVQQ